MPAALKVLVVFVVPINALARAIAIAVGGFAFRGLDLRRIGAI